MKIGLITVNTVLSVLHLMVEINILKSCLLWIFNYIVSFLGRALFGSLVLFEFSFLSLIKKSSAVKH